MTGADKEQNHLVVEFAEEFNVLAWEQSKQLLKNFSFFSSFKVFGILYLVF